MIGLCMSALAVTQEGNVRTIGRKDKPGTPIDGAIIRIRGAHNAVQSHENGDFSLLLHNMNNGDPYAISSIVKSGYEPAEQELIGRKMPCSDKVPLEILLVNRADLQKEKEAIENKARENVEQYYQDKLAVLEQQLATKTLSEQEFAQQLDALESQYERFEPLLQAMSDKLARTDYSRMDSLTTLIQTAIENGNPEEAERLVREKGNMDEREAAIRAQEEQQVRAQQTLDEAQQQLDQQRAVTAQQKRELADDYYHMYAAFLSRFQNDSAALYICKRAELDTLNFQYQIDAGLFVKDIIANYSLARVFFERAHRIAPTQYGEQSAQMATGCHELGAIIKLQGDLDTAMRLYQQALPIKEQVHGKNSKEVAETLNNIAELYRAKGDLKNAMTYNQRALKIHEKIFGDNSLEVADSKNNIAGIYFQLKEYKKAEKIFEEVRAIHQANTQTPPLSIAQNYNNLAGVMYMQGHYEDALHMFEQALATYKRVLGDTHPLTRNAKANLQAVQQQIDSQK